VARKYKVEGTKSYLVASIVLFLLSIWFIHDGWFPSEAVLEKHPPGTDTYYQFNRITGVGLFIFAAICAYIHQVVK